MHWSFGVEMEAFGWPDPVLDWSGLDPRSNDLKLLRI